MAGIIRGSFRFCAVFVSGVFCLIRRRFIGVLYLVRKLLSSSIIASAEIYVLTISYFS